MSFEEGSEYGVEGNDHVCQMVTCVILFKTSRDSDTSVHGVGAEYNPSCSLP